ncbi:MAG: trigger factor [Candidatus Eiseniibacteriota bacterium]
MNVKVQIERQEAWRRVLAIEVPLEDVEREYEKVAARVAKRVRVKGFRKGKVPVTMVRKTFKPELDQEFLETVVPRAFDKALQETGLDPITEPKFEDLSFGAERPLSFRADFECRPELDPQGFQGLAAEKEVPEVTDEHVDRVLESFRKSHASLEEVQRKAIDGDVVVVDYQAVDSEDRPLKNRQVKGYPVELGAGRVVEAFESVLREAGPGDVRVAEVPYPADHDDPSLAGSTARYRIRVGKVQEKRFPSLTDDLVKAHTEQQTVEELRAKVRENLEEQADRAGVERLEQILLDRVVDANPFDPPTVLVEGLLEDLVERSRREAAAEGRDADAVDWEQLRGEARPAAGRQVRRMLLLDAIARKEKIEVEDQELGERIAVMARLGGMAPRPFVERMGGNRFVKRLSRELRDKKVLAFLVQNAEITVKKVPAGTRETN